MKLSKYIFNILVIILIPGFFYSFSLQTKLSSQLIQILQEQNPAEKNLVWIYFSDKGEFRDLNVGKPELFLTKKSIERRIKRAEKIADFSDIPVCNEYIRQITESGIQIKNKSKWFNAVSCYADKIEIERVIRNEFVREVGLVKKYSRLNNQTDILSTGFGTLVTDDINVKNYGPSYNQSDIINVPPVHEQGYTGKEILIASFDSGFDNLEHPCFDSMITRGVRTYDFVNGDTIVANGTGRLGNGAHGTLTLSLVAGYQNNSLISPAFRSDYILAKTENTQSETPLEEDNWIAAAEWADSLGADIITSSLGYLNYDPPYPSYTWESMDGNTAMITKAADMAVNKGIVVVISSGNDGYNSSHNTLNVPADADSIITVGSVNLNKERSSFSSIGPTSDGRIKPDVMALGNGNYCARFGAGNTGYTSAVTGTSLACPMVAGVCALILSANQELNPIQVRNILRTTADSSSNPNSLRGWGVVNALAAVDAALNFENSIAEDYKLFQNYPNPFNPSTKISYELKYNSFVSIKIYNTLGKETATLVNENKNSGSYEINFNAGSLSSGVYFYTLIVNGNYADTKKMVLLR